MALSIKPAKSSTQASGCLSLSIYDATGAYSSTENTGGYGAPNPLYTDINKIVLRVFRPNETVNYEDITLDSGTTPTAVQYATPSGGYTFSLNSINTGQSTGSETLIDGVYTIQEFVVYEAILPNAYLSVVSGETTVNFNNTIQNLCGFADFNYILMPDGNFYEIASIDGSSLELVLPYEGETVVNTELWYFVYSGIGYAMNYCSADKCMTSLLADQFVADVQNGCCSKGVSETAEHAFYEFYILKADEANNDFSAFATNIEVYNSKYCSGSTGGCGCGCN